MEYIAHINELTKMNQTVKEHSENTAKLSKDFSIEEMKDLVYIIGLIHDIGKYQQLFQRRINGENIKVEHSACGALAAKEKYLHPIATMMEYCIVGHHSGLPDGGALNDTQDMSTLQGRLKRNFGDYSAYKEELEIPDINQEKFLQYLTKDCFNDASMLIDKFAFLTRYSFSCLVDADSTDTATFCQTISKKSLSVDFSACLNRISRKLSGFVCETSLQKSRALLQEQVFKKITANAEIYLMNMPTGSGKTLCSMKFALERVRLTGKKRIIYIAPYNSIIDQTADNFDNLFQNDAEILRHQSSFSYEDEENGSEDYREAAKNATENWDAPMIISTVVQFFESVYANKRGKLRKLHNLADSILIFDEAHLMPQQYLQPCLQAIVYITKYLNSEAVFLTATMPDFPKLIKEYALPNSIILDLIEDTSMFHAFQKCTYHNLGEINCEKLLEKAAGYSSSLIIVNKKAKARELYKMCTGQKFHLSTYMIACDRSYVIHKIKDALHQLENDFSEGDFIPKDRRITIISTSLIEAGVDLDMHVVFRELNGLDSILQSGGRCNREGKRSNGETFVFCFKEESTRAYADERINLTEGLLKKYPDISCKEAVKEYYDRLFFLKKDEIENQSISQRSSALESIPFKEYAEDFEIINSYHESIVVAKDEKSLNIIENMRYSGVGSARKLQRYVCSVNRKEFEDLYRQHVIEDYGTGIWCLTNNDYYDENLGITFEAKDYFLL